MLLPPTPPHASSKNMAKDLHELAQALEASLDPATTRDGQSPKDKALSCSFLYSQLSQLRTLF